MKPGKTIGVLKRCGPGSVCIPRMCPFQQTSPADPITAGTSREGLFGQESQAQCTLACSELRSPTSQPFVVVQATIAALVFTLTCFPACSSHAAAAMKA